MKFSVVIVTYNRLSLLKECICNVINQTLKFTEVVIVNNYSTDGTKEFLEKIDQEYDEIKVINLSENLGGAGGFKHGLKSIAVDTDYVLLIDDDAILDVDFLENIYANIKDGIMAYSGTVYVNNVIDTSHRRRIVNKIFMTKKDVDIKEYEKTMFEYDLSTFCGLIVNYEVIKKCGLPNAEYFIWYDDTEYSMRIGEYTKICNINNAKINHKTVLPSDSRLSWKSFYGYRNAIDMGRKYSKFPLIFLLYRYTYHIYRYLYYFFLGLKNKEDHYYKKCRIMQMDVLKAAINKKLGFNEKYNSKVKFW